MDAEPEAEPEVTAESESEPEVQAESEPEEKPEPDSGPEQKKRSRPGLWVLAVAMLLVSGWMWMPVDDDESDAADVIADYLEAARTGDIGTALDLAGKHPRGEEARFLAPEAVSPDWRVTEVTELSHSDNDYSDDKGEKATVKATVETEKGKSATGEFELNRKDGGKWKIAEPFVEVRVDMSLLWFVNVNGVNAPYRISDDDDVADTAKVLLLPGAYRFYTDLPETVEPVKTPTVPLVSDTHRVTVGESEVLRDTTDVPGLKLSEAGADAVDAAMRDYIDGCAEIAATVVAGCPFGAEHVPDPRDDDYYLDVLTKIDWNIDEYPTVVAVPESDALKITDRQRGTAELAATGVESDKNPDDPINTELKCDIKTSRLEAGILPDGTMRIYPEGHRYSLKKFARDPILWETC